MKKLLLAVITTACMSFGMAFADTFQEGKDYTVVAKPVKVEVSGKIEVREFFWYSCSHCYKLEPHMQKWLKAIPKDVRFTRSHAAVNPVWEQAARGYYASDLLGVRQKSHLAVFHAIHDKKLNLSYQQAQGKFFIKYGIPEAKFKDAFYSPEVTAKIKQSNRLAKELKLVSVPAVVVNGKYIVQGDGAKVVQVLDYLIEKERKAK